MSKININDITTQFGFKDAINAKLQQIEDEFNNKVFYRNNPTGEPNSLNNDLDMGNNDILNINKITVNDIGVVGESSFKELIVEAQAAVTAAEEQATLSGLYKDASALSASQSATSATTAASAASDAQAAALLVDPRMDAVEAEVATQTTSINTFKADVSNLFGALIGSIQSIFCSDSYVPLGMVPANGTEYTRSQFPDLYDNFLVGGKLLTTDYTSFTTQIGLTGNCAKFALDTVNQKFKVPFIKDGDSITQASSAAELGKSVEAGLPNITGTIYPTSDATSTLHLQVSASSPPTGAFAAANTGVSAYNVGGTGVSNRAVGIKLDASLSSSKYGNSNTVTDEQVRLRHFVVLASAQNSASVFDWSNYMAGLAGKLNADFSNADLSKCNAVLQQVRYSTTSAASGSTVIPNDSTIPQITEGDQYLSARITPKSANSILVIEVIANFSNSAAAQVIGALFRDNISNALAAGITWISTGSAVSNMKLTHFMSSPGVSPTTFKFRLGPASGQGGTVTINPGLGVMRSGIIITEYAA